jgi:regulator of sigma E protease
MEGMIMTAQLLLSLSFLIVVHEWGHFFAARTFNIKVEKFYLFFDFLFPMANVLNFSLLKVKRGDTEYGVGWFPMGGYVKIAGMVDESMDKEQLKTPPQPWEFRAKPAWQRLIVMLGGIIVNLIVGVIIYIFIVYLLGDTYIPKDFVNRNGGIQVFEIGEKIGLKTGDQIIKINGSDFTDFQDITKPDHLLSPNSYYTVLRHGQEVNVEIPGNFIENFNKKDALSNFVGPRTSTVIAQVQKGSLAARLGLREGDRFIEVQGTPVNYQDELIKLVKNQPLNSISFKVERNGEILAFTEPFAGQTIIGFIPKPFYEKKDLQIITYGLGESIAMGTKRAFEVIFVQIKAFKKIFSGELSLKNSLSGPVGIAKAYGGEWDWERFWRMTGTLSMVLAFMNLLPIPGLDGGYVVFLLYEMASGREPNEKVFETALKIGMAILLVLMVFVFYNDIAKLITGN